MPQLSYMGALGSRQKKHRQRPPPWNALVSAYELSYSLVGVPTSIYLVYPENS